MEGLKWSRQADELLKKLRKAWYQLCLVRGLFPEKVKLLVYYSLFHSQLTYGAEAVKYNKGQLDKINVIQRKAIRLVAGTRYNAHTAPHRKRLQILTYDETRDLRACQIINKFKNDTLPRPLRGKFRILKTKTRQNGEIDSYITMLRNWAQIHKECVPNKVFTDGQLKRHMKRTLLKNIKLCEREECDICARG